MVSPELIRRYRFFAGLDMEQINTLAKLAEEETVEEEHYFFREGEALHAFYIVQEGTVAIVVELPKHEREIVTSTMGTGEVFGWSSIVPPYTSTAGAKSLTPCKVIRFDCSELWKIFENDCRFGYLMTQKAAKIIRERLRDMRIESLGSSL